MIAPRIDKKTELILLRISANMPEELKNSVTKKVVNDTEEDLARIAIKSKGIAEYKKKRLKKMLAAGKFRWEDVIVNEDTVSLIDVYLNQEIRRATLCGTLKDPTKDPVFRARIIKANRQKLESGDSLSKGEKLKAAQLLLT